MAAQPTGVVTPSPPSGSDGGNGREGRGRGCGQEDSQDPQSYCLVDSINEMSVREPFRAPGEEMAVSDRVAEDFRSYPMLMMMLM